MHMKIHPKKETKAAYREEKHAQTVAHGQQKALMKHLVVQIFLVEIHKNTVNYCTVDDQANQDKENSIYSTVTTSFHMTKLTSLVSLFRSW